MTARPAGEVSCAAFAEAVTDLVVHGVPEPERARLLAHAHTCARCEAELAGVLSVSDALLDLAPDVEPPDGFETRLRDRISRDGRSPARRRRGLRRVGLVAALGAAAAFGALLAVATQRGDERIASGVVTTSTGARLGTVDLDARHDVPRIVVSIAPDVEWGGTWVCELEDDDGAWIEVGAWTADDANGGVWATAVPRELADSDAMRILGPSGAPIAVAHLDH